MKCLLPTIIVAFTIGALALLIWSGIPQIIFEVVRYGTPSCCGGI